MIFLMLNFCASDEWALGHAPHGLAGDLGFRVEPVCQDVLSVTDAKTLEGRPALMDDFDTALAALKRRHEENGPLDIRAAFEADSSRFDSLSARLDDLLVDFSKCALGADDLAQLVALA